MLANWELTERNHLVNHWEKTKQEEKGNAQGTHGLIYQVSGKVYKRPRIPGASRREFTIGGGRGIMKMNKEYLRFQCLE